MKKTWISILILFVLASVTVYFNMTKSENTNSDELDSLEIKAEKGYRAPDFTITDMNGNKVSLKDYAGKPVFINFWASWCEPCREEMPYIEEAYTQYKDQIEFLMINVIAVDTIKDMQAFMNEFGLTFPVLLDQKNTVSDLYRIYGYPTSYFITDKGVIAEKVAGGMSKQMFNRLLKNILQD